MTELDMVGIFEGTRIAHMNYRPSGGRWTEEQSPVFGPPASGGRAFSSAPTSWLSQRPGGWARASSRSSRRTGMARAADVRRLAERIAEAFDDAVRLLGAQHPVALKLLAALKDVARTLEAVRT
jgi:hypothetical protein